MPAAGGGAEEESCLALPVQGTSPQRRSRLLTLVVFLHLWLFGNAKMPLGILGLGLGLRHLRARPLAPRHGNAPGSVGRAGGATLDPIGPGGCLGSRSGAERGAGHGRGARLGSAEKALSSSCRRQRIALWSRHGSFSFASSVVPGAPVSCSFPPTCEVIAAVSCNPLFRGSSLARSTRGDRAAGAGRWQGRGRFREPVPPLSSFERVVG